MYYAKFRRNRILEYLESLKLISLFNHFNFQFLEIILNEHLYYNSNRHADLKFLVIPVSPAL